MEVNVKEARAKISALLDRTEKGENIVIVRRGVRVARLVPIDDSCGKLPDLSGFRASIIAKPNASGNAVAGGRAEERY